MAYVSTRRQTILNKPTTQVNNGPVENKATGKSGYVSTRRQEVLGVSKPKETVKTDTKTDTKTAPLGNVADFRKLEEASKTAEQPIVKPLMDTDKMADLAQKEKGKTASISVKPIQNNTVTDKLTRDELRMHPIVTKEKTGFNKYVQDLRDGKPTDNVESPLVEKPNTSSAYTEKWLRETVGTAETIGGKIVKGAAGEEKQSVVPKEYRSDPTEKVRELGDKIIQSGAEEFQKADELRQSVIGDNKATGAVFDILSSVPDMVLSAGIAGAVAKGAVTQGVKLTAKELAKALLSKETRNMALKYIGKNAVKTLIPDLSSLPIGAKSFATTYQDAIKRGATEDGATAAAFVSSYIEALIEKGGVQKAIKEGTFGQAMDFVKEGLGEGNEEFWQGMLSPAAMKYIAGIEDIPVTGEGGIIDPKRMAQDFAAGAVMGFGFGGTGVAANSNYSANTNENEGAKSAIPSTNQPTVNQQQTVPEQVTPIAPAQEQPIKQVKTPAKSYEQQMDETIAQQQETVDDLSYRKFYNEENVDTELETEMVKLQELKDTKDKFLSDKKTEVEKEQRAYELENGVPDITQYLSDIPKATETTETKTVEPMASVDVQNNTVPISKVKPIKNDSRGNEFDERYKNKLVGAKKSLGGIYTDKPVWEMDSDEYLNYNIDELELSRDANGQAQDNNSDVPQFELYQDLKAIEDKYSERINNYRKSLYTKNNTTFPENGYEARTSVLNSDMQKKIDEYETKQNEMVQAEKQETINNYAAKTHKAMITDAVNAGKEVPANILEKYPYLRMKSGIMKANNKGGEKNEAVSSTAGKTNPITQIGRGTTNPTAVIFNFKNAESKDKGTAAPTDKKITGNTTKAYDNDGNEYEFQYAVVSVDDLIASHDANMKQNPSYPQELQPRDRERVASRLQVDKIAYNIQPELLGESPKISDGAPIIGDDNIVESGNGRVIALKKMYESTKEGKAKYVKWLKDNAEKFGIDANNIPEDAVLVRVRNTDVDRGEFVKKANEASVATMSSTETAKTDADRLTDRILGLFSSSEDGTINTAENRPFIAAFVGQVIPSNDIGKYITSDGYLSQDGLSRLRNAIFYKAYGSDRLLTKISESTDNNIKNITNTLINIAPKIVSIKDAIKKGSLYNIDYSSDITGSVEKYINLKNSKTQIDEYLNQNMLFDDGVSAESKYILSVLDNTSRSAKKLTEFFTEVLDSVEALGNPGQVNMFGEQTPINKMDVLENAYRRFVDNGQEILRPIGETGPGEASESKSISGSENRGIEKKTEGEESKTVIETGKPFSATMFHGKGKTAEQIYSFAQYPVAGEGVYYAFNEETAKEYGNNVTVANVKIKKPFVIKDDSDWRKLTVNNVGWEYPNPIRFDDEAGTIKDIKALKDYLTSKGYDGLIVNFESDKSGDVNAKTGNAIKTLSNVFGHDQVVVYNKETSSSEEINSLTAVTSPPLPQGTGTGTFAKTMDDLVEIIEGFTGVPIRTGKFKQRALGIFKVKSEVIRTKIRNDLPVICHELGHYFDKKHGFYGSDKFDGELIPLGRVTSRASYKQTTIRKEGIAEFLRIYLTDHIRAKSVAPKFLVYFEAVIDSDEMNFLSQLRTDVTSIVNLKPEDRVYNSVSSYESRTNTIRKAPFFQRLMNQWIDKDAVVGRIQEEAEKKGYSGKNLKTTFENLRGLEAAVETMIMDKQRDIDGNIIFKSFAEIMKPISKRASKKLGYDHFEVRKNFVSYMVARRAMDYRERGLAMPDVWATYADTITRMEDKYGKLFTDIFDDIRTWEDNSLEMLVKSGIKSRDEIDAIKMLNANHVPLQRIQETIDVIRTGSGNTVGQSKQVLKRAVGSGSTIIDPIESIITNAFIVTRAAKSNNALRVLKSMTDIDAMGKWIEAVPDKTKSNRFSVEDVRNQLVKIAKENGNVDLIESLKKMSNAELESSVSIFYTIPKEEDNEVIIYEKGKGNLYEVDTELYKAIKGLNKEQSNLVVRILNVPKRVLQTGVVTTVEFMVRNINRDVQTSLIQSEAGINPVDIIKGYVSAFTKDDSYKELLAMGGGTEYFNINSRAAAQKLEDDVMGYGFTDKFKRFAENIAELKKNNNDRARRKIANSIASLIGDIPDAIRSLVDWSEMGPRIAEYNKAITKGYSKEEAAAMGRRVTQDFARHGYYGKEVNKVTAFFNANIQGTTRLVESFKKQPGKTMVRGFMAVTLPTLLLYFFNHDDEDYQNMPNWRKTLFWNIPIGDGHFFSIPRPYGYSFIFGAVPEIMLDKILHEDPKTFDRLKDSFTQNFNIPIMLATFKPGIETAMNRQWNNTPIEGTWDRSNFPAYLIRNERTSKLATSLGDFLKNEDGLSPKQIDYLIKGYFGSVGEFLWRIPDKIKDGVEIPSSPAELPLIKEFMTDSVYTNDTTNDLYDYSSELTKRAKEFKATGKYRGLEDLNNNELKIVNTQLEKLRKESNKVIAKLSDERDVIETIQADKKLSDEMKEIKSREIRRLMNKEAEAFNKEYEQFKKDNEIK